MHRIFISYRREDTAADANALYQSLAARFGPERLYKDVDNVPLGANWKIAVQEAVSESAVVLPLIGPNWRCSGAIRLELETAFKLRVPVVPLLVSEARMDDVAGQLDGELRELADLNAASLDHDSWNRDLGPVLDALTQILERTSPSELPEESLSEVPAAAVMRNLEEEWPSSQLASTSPGRGQLLGSPGHWQSSLISILRGHSAQLGSSLLIAPSIPEGKLANAVDAFGVPAHELVVAIWDSASLMHSARKGVVFGTESVYMRNDWQGKTPGLHFMTYAELARSTIKRGGLYEVQVATDYYLNTQSVGKVLSLFHAIQRKHASQA